MSWTAASRLKCSAVSSCSSRSAMTSSSAAAEASVVSAPFAAAAAACSPVEATKAPQSLLSRCSTCGSSGARIGSSHALLLAAHHSWMSLNVGSRPRRESKEPEQASPHKDWPPRSVQTSRTFPLACMGGMGTWQIAKTKRPF